MNKDDIKVDEKLSMDDLDTAAGGASGGLIEVDGTISEALPNAMFQVDLDDGHRVRCNISGKLRMNYIRIRPGDRVTVQINPSDYSRGRIVWRCK